MENVVCKRPLKTNALGNRNGCLELERPRDKWKSIRKLFEEVRNSYAVRTSLCEESKSLSTLENLSEGIIRKERVVLNEKENSKGIKSLGKDGLKESRKCNESRHEDGFVGGEIKSPSKRNEYPGCYEVLRSEEMLKVEDFVNKISGNIQVSQGRASRYKSLKRQSLCEKYYLVLIRVEI